MKNKPVIIAMIGCFLLSFSTVSNVVAEKTTLLNTHKFIAGENVILSHSSPAYPGSITVKLDNDEQGVDENGKQLVEIIKRFKVKEDYDLTSISLCLRNPESAPPFAINIYKLDVPIVEPIDPVLMYTLFQSSGEPAYADEYCTAIALDPPVKSTGETLLLGISFDFELPPALSEPVAALDSELPIAAIISAVGLGQTSTYLMIEDCNTTVPDIDVDGTPLSELIDLCSANAKNHGKFVRCVSKTANALKKAGDISGKEKGKITSCAAKSDLPNN